MFELSLVELAVIALVALLVLGPERLPRAARTVGMYARRARQSWSAVRADIERELAADDLRRSMQEHVDAATRGASALRDELNATLDRGDRLDGPLSGQVPPRQLPQQDGGTDAASGTASERARGPAPDAGQPRGAADEPPAR